MSLRRFLRAAACPTLLLAARLAAQAQSTATEEIETVTSTALGSGVSGIMLPVTVPKQRSTIGPSYLVTQAAGQVVMESLNKAPGFNFTNNDPFGSSGGNLRIHGYDGNHISLTWDGMPLNDTGNYAIFTNQLADPEIVGQVSVNQGATDVDSPSAAASGGVVAIRTARPSDTFSVMFQSSFGSFHYQRYFAKMDFGAFGPWNTLGFVSYAFAENDKFKGPGQMSKRQFNLSLYQDMGARGFITFGAHWNTNRNNNFLAVSFFPTSAALLSPNTCSPAAGNICPVGTPNTAYDPSTGEIGGVGARPGAGANSGYGLTLDYAAFCQRVAPGPGAQSDTLCANYYKRQINPSDTGNIRVSSLWRLTDAISLAIDPSIQYVLANGGSQYTQLNERDPRLIGTASVTGKDLNGDSDLEDVVGVFGPSNTNTVRYGLNTSLLWNVSDDHTLQLAYTLDYGLHKQTGQAAFLQPDGSPYEWFGGYRDAAHRVLTADGSTLRTRDRKSHAILNQGAFSYEGDYFDGVLHVSAGGRLPFLTRDLNQSCYLQALSATAIPSPNVQPGVGFQLCSTQAPVTVNAANNTVTLAGYGNALFVGPEAATLTYTRFLPNVGFSLKPFGDDAMFYVAWASSLSAPRVDNLYNGGNNGQCAGPGGITHATAANPGCVFSSFNKSVRLETSNNYTIGLRYHDDLVSLTVDAYNNQFKNRIVTSFDQDLGISLDRNIGSVNVNGVDAELGLFLFEGFSSYTSVSWFHSRVSDTPDARICLNAACSATANIANKEVVESPDMQISQRFQYRLAGFTLGLGAKYVGRRYATDNNDLRIPGYVLVDSDITYDLGEVGWTGSHLRFNALNLFDETWFGSISSQRCSTAAGCLMPFMNVGYPQTFQVTLRTMF